MHAFSDKVSPLPCRVTPLPMAAFVWASRQVLSCKPFFSISSQAVLFAGDGRFLRQGFELFPAALHLPSRCCFLFWNDSRE